MSKHLLHKPDFACLPIKVGGKGVSQRMRRDVLEYSRSIDVLNATVPRTSERKF